MIGSTKTKTLKRIQFSANNAKNISRHKKRKKGQIKAIQHNEQ